MAVALRDGRPVRLYYRDFGGVRISPARLARHGVEAPPLLGDLASDDPAVLRTKLAAAALSGVVAEVVALLGREYALDTGALWRLVAAALHRAYDTLPADARGDRDTLCEYPLPVKATTAMRLADSPLDDRWARLPNPMAGAR
jgi:siderophore synthetase component